MVKTTASPSRPSATPRRRPVAGRRPVDVRGWLGGIRLSGFMVIMLAGRQGIIGDFTQWLTGEKLVFAYSMAGLFVGYAYFSIPRTILTVMAAAEKLDPKIEEAARSLGASPLRVVKDVIVPGLKPAFIAAGAICFATAMGAFGTAFTLATRINVLPMVIYTEFTLEANIAMAARNGADGWFKVTTTVRSSGASTLFITENMPAMTEPSASRSRSRLNFASLAFSGLPSLNISPSRRWNV